MKTQPATGETYPKSDLFNKALYDLRRMDVIMEALDNRSSMDWCAAVHDMNAGFDETILFPSSVESTAG
ncbi:hypothetical protein [Escherichia coli]|uniref:hypothetical protein n=1 Tax=Escherichia coli TaxID=562 RepID=UPI00307651B5